MSPWPELRVPDLGRLRFSRVRTGRYQVKLGAWQVGTLSRQTVAPTTWRYVYAGQDGVRHTGVTGDLTAAKQRVRELVTQEQQRGSEQIERRA
jgi:hypothetical protein